jgi:hypothetical protein
LLLRARERVRQPAPDRGRENCSRPRRRATSAKQLHELGKVSRAAAAIDDLAERGIRPEPRKAPALGKKEQRQAAAEQVTGKFAPPAPPKLIVNNR